MHVFQLSPKDWIYAHQQLDEKENGFFRLKHEKKSSQYGQLFFSAKTNYRYLKISQTLLALAPLGEGLLGRGNYGSVHLATDELGDLWAIKIERNAKKPSLAEFRVLADLELATHRFNSPSSGKTYTVMRYLGSSLSEKLLSGELDFRTRIRIAVQLCLQVSDLHQGLLSKTATPYAHLDIKPENVVIDEDNIPHLIDFGFADRNPLDITEEIKGTSVALPRLKNISKIPKTYLDSLALKRTLYFPAMLRCQSGLEYRAPEDPSFFDDDELAELGLGAVLDTGILYKESLKDHSGFYSSPRAMAAMLAIAYLDLSISYDDVDIDACKTRGQKARCHTTIDKVLNLFESSWRKIQPSRDVPIVLGHANC